MLSRTHQVDGAQRSLLPGIQRDQKNSAHGAGVTLKAELSPTQSQGLYRLGALAERSQADVLLVEGEKTADAAARLLPEMVVTTWSGGANAVGKTDLLTPITREDVFLLDL